MPFGGKKVGITLKQKRFAREYVRNGGNASKAALKVYEVMPKFAKNQGASVLKSPNVQKEIKDILNANGLSLDDLTQKAVDVVNKGLEEGTPSFSSASDMLKFLFKIHDVVPASKSMSAKLNIKTEKPSEFDLKQGKETLLLLNKLSDSLLKELEK